MSCANLIRGYNQTWKSGEMAQVKIGVVGPFVLEIDGKCVTPRLAKSQAIVAILALREKKTVSRKWLQALLWPDRAEAQASGSLRACLKEIRKIFVGTPDCLSIGRQTITLHEDKVEIDLCSSKAVQGSQILEGFDLPYSDTFEDWLRETRSHYDTSPQTALHSETIIPATRQITQRNLKKLFVIRPIHEPVGAAHFQFISLIDSAVSFVGERMNIWVQYIDSESELSDERGFVLETNLASKDHENLFHFRLKDLELETLVWAKTFQIEAGAGPHSDDYRSIVNFIADVVELQLMKQADNAECVSAEQFLRRGISRISKLDKLTWHDADEWLKHSFEVRPSAISSAWRSYLRTLMHAERQDGDRHDVKLEGIEFARKAMELEPNNSMVLGLSAHTMSLLANSHDVAYELSNKALLINPSNPFALATKGIAQSHLGEVEQGYKNAAKAQRIGNFSNLKPFLDLSAAITATISHDFEAALKYTNICNALAPKLGAPLRYLTALSFHFGNEAEGYASAERLRELEKGFDLDWMKEAEYPSAGLKKSGLLGALPTREI